MPRFVLGQQTDAGLYFHVTPELLTPYPDRAKVFEANHPQEIVNNERGIGHLNMIMDLDTNHAFPFASAL